MVGLVATAAAITGAIIYTQVPLEVPRPASSQAVAYRDRSVQDVAARLWEDPFAAVSREIRAGGPNVVVDMADLAELAQQNSKSTTKEESGAAVAVQTLDPCEGGKSQRKECEPHTMAWLMRDLRFNLGQDRAASGKQEAGQAKQAAARNAPRVLILGVMVSNAPYVDGEEKRRRMRYAVQSAFNLAQYSPVNAEHIGYVVNRDEPGLPQIIPFEWMKRKGAERRALVLWLEEEAITGYPARAPTPIGNLARMLDNFRRQSLAQPGQLDFKLIGPATSGTLRAMVTEIKQTRKTATANAPPLAALRGVEMFSALATASDEQMLRKKEDRKQARNCGGTEACTLGQFFDQNSEALTGDAKQPFRFVRTVASDDLLTTTLINELARRGVDLASGHDHVALISEWDTYYGRMLPQAFVRSLDEVSDRDHATFEQACEEDVEEAIGTPPTRTCPVLRFSYLRGLDGQQLQVAPSPVQSAPAGARGDAAKAAPLEHAEGAKQFDYLRRLADRIQVTSARLKREGKELSAIGIIGSDVYDKLAVLRALRKQFPRAIFFSTDLDARLLDRADYGYARNLLFGSSFGLELHPCLQKEIPPFRNSNQTSMFFAARLALYNAFGDLPARGDRCPEYESVGQGLSAAQGKGAAPISQSQIDLWLFPRIFEVGKSRAWDLTVEPTGERACLGLHACVSVHPARDYLFQRSSKIAWVTLGTFGLLAFGLIIKLARRYRQESAELREQKRKRLPHLGLGMLRWLLMLWALAVAGVCLWYANQDWRDAAGEPFAWLDGISIWPTQLLQIVAMLLAAFFLGDVFSRLRQSDETMTRDLELSATWDPRTFRQRLFGVFLLPEAAVDGSKAAVLWNQYLRSGRPGFTLLRALFFAALFGALAWWLTLTFGLPNRPYRGVVSNWVDWVLFGHVAFFTVALLFCVSDVTRLTTAWILALGRERKDLTWPEGIVARFAHRYGIKGDSDVAASLVPLQLIAKRTAAINSLIYYPFLVGALVLVCRSSLFDNWDLPISVIVLFAVGLVVACAGPLIMQRAASKAKSECLKLVETRRLHSAGTGDTVRKTAFDTLMEHVRSMKEGAFLPFLEQPLVRAALLPFGGAGGVYLLDFFSFGGF